MEEQEIIELKRKINEFIWQHGRSDMKLEDAESAACHLLESLYPGSIPDFDGHASAAKRDRRLDSLVE